MIHIRKFDESLTSGAEWRLLSPLEMDQFKKGQSIDTISPKSIERVLGAMSGTGWLLDEQSLRSGQKAYAGTRIPLGGERDSVFMNVRQGRRADQAKKPWMDFSAWFDGIRDVHRLRLTDPRWDIRESRLYYEMYMFILKTADDYYLVEYHGHPRCSTERHYVCDGISGLCDLLSHLKR